MSTFVRQDHRARSGHVRASRGREIYVAAVYRASRWRRRAACTCGWSGARHFLRGTAVVDALVHAADSGHEPACPLVVGRASVHGVDGVGAGLGWPWGHLKVVDS
ncbi:hypothetical protein [Mycobacterium sp. JS623]|uniref:hypothetical protein n=1 Tax=Mycobacterium sp. JS623 TaxID=212767 RepID=UPI00059CC179|nr:hypothetical protein [Mycobacterium sp. JS623]